MKQKAGFRFSVQKQTMPESSDAYLAKKLYLDTRPESHLGGRSAAGASTSSMFSRKKLSHGGLFS